MKVLEKFKGLKLLFISQEDKPKCPPDTEEVVDFSKIYITKDFRMSYPSPQKIIQYSKDYQANGMIDKAIVVSKGTVDNQERYILRDGYIRYLILRQEGINNIPVRLIRNELK
jgi:hypothetical protein